MNSTAKAKAKRLLKPSHQAVLRFLEKYQHPDSGLCTPTTKEVAAGVGISPAYTRQLLSELAAMGAVEREACWYEWDYETGASISAAPHPIPWLSAQVKEFGWEAVRRGSSYAPGPFLYRVLMTLLLSAALTASYATFWKRRPCWACC